MATRSVSLYALVLSVGLTVAGAVLAGEVPVVVSPGDISKLALTGDACPTFSWAGVPAVDSYELVVYDVREVGGESMEVLRQAVPGGATNWTPSLDRCLERGGQYAWSVRAVRQGQASEWSPPSLFRVAAGPSEAEFEEALAVVRQYVSTRTEDTAFSGDTPPRVEAGPEITVPNPSGDPEKTTTTQLSVDGGVVAVSFTGDGSTLTSLDPTNIAPGTANISITGTANPTGTAGGELAGTYPDPTVVDTIARDIEVTAAVTAHKNLPNDHHTPPTELPPTGAAGGDLTGTYPNPTVGTNAVASAEIVDSSVATGDLAFDPATQGELDTHTGLPAAHHTPTIDTDTTCLDAGVACNFAASTSEGGAATSGDSATAFFSKGQIEEPRIANAVARDSEVKNLIFWAQRCPTGVGFRYFDQGNGTVVDCATGLIWLKDANCFSFRVWNTAQSDVAGLANGACGLTDGSSPGDWRLPTISEFCSAWSGGPLNPCPAGAAANSLVDSSVGPPTLVNATGSGVWTEGDAFNNVQQSREYWSATELNPLAAWVASLNTGFIDGDVKNDENFVWPVRTGP